MMCARSVALSDDQLATIQFFIQELLDKSKGVAVLLADATGQPIAHAGDLDEGDRLALATLAAGSFAATVAMARLLGQEGAFEQVLFEGDRHSVQSSVVVDGYLLTIAYDSRARAGLVRLLTQKAVKKLRDVLSEARDDTVDASARDVIDDGFGDSLAEQLDELLP
jgi:predicted regulator of Ras-like GTPase activity (Roadblock/LC7/MglB family)